MCFYVLQSLPAEVAEKPYDLIYKISVKVSYYILKDAIIERTKLSDQQRLDALTQTLK